MVNALSGSTPYSPMTPVRATAIHEFRELLFQCLSLIHSHKQELGRIVEDQKASYIDKTDDLKANKDTQGSYGLRCTIAGAMLGAVVPFLPSLDAASFDFEALFDALGGVESAKKLCEMGSHAAEGCRPVLNSWAEGKALPEQTVKEFLEISFRQGQEAERQDRELVDKLVRVADEVYHSYGAARYK